MAHGLSLELAEIKVVTRPASSLRAPRLLLSKKAWNRLRKRLARGIANPQERLIASENVKAKRARKKFYREA